MRGDVGRDDQDAVQAKRFTRRQRRVEVSHVNGIQRPAEYADPLPLAHSVTGSVVCSRLTAVARSRAAATSRHAASSNAGSPSPVAADTA